MKKQIKSFIALTAILVASVQANALEIAVAPMQLKGHVEVAGVQAAVDGEAAIVLAGDTAVAVAKRAGVTLNATKEVLVITGEEVSELVAAAAKKAGTVGQNTLIATAELSQDALALTQDAVNAGVSIVVVGKDIVTAGTVEGLRTLANLSKGTLSFVDSTGVVVVESGARLIAGARGLLGALLDFLLL
ncbi:hypothetical protein GW915_09540 [bacterium]|nr:hypothetical protein [bacterium]